MADFGSSEAGKKGGKARAEKLSPEERSQIAKRAALKRWEDETPDESIPAAVCGSDEHPLRIGEVEIPCYVLDDERRVITLTGMQRAIGMSPSGGAPRLASFIGGIEPNSATANELAVRLESPIAFRPFGGGKPAYGYEGELLAELCQAILSARRAKKLTKRYAHIADRAEVLLGGFATVGITALIDEATGFQKYRKRLALADILDKYLDGKLNQWTKTFPDEFYEEFFRLKGWDFENLKPGQVKPAEVGNFTREQVYRRLHPGIVTELEQHNPYIAPGRWRHKHHQWLSREVGHPMLEKHLAAVITAMRLSKDWLHFESNLQRALPRRSDTGFFGFIDDDD